jgi:hypothetical protein
MTTMAYGSTGRRVAAVSTGTLLLCLWGGGTAFAATSPLSDGGLGGVTGTVTSVISPTPTVSPTPLATPSQLDPVSQTVTTVTTTVTNAVQPTASPTVAPTAVPTGGNAPDGKTSSGGVRVPTTSSGANHQVLGTHHTRRASTGTMTVPAMPLDVAGLRAAGAPSVPMLNPKVAPQQTAVLAAGSTPAIAPAPHGLQLPSNGDRAPRGLFIALATMVIGGLAAGHVKVAQDRMGYSAY